MKERISKLINQLFSANVFWRLFSIVFAIFLWAMVVNTEDPIETRTFTNVEVEIVNADAISDLNQTYEVKSGDKISFSIRGKKSIIDKMKKSDFEVTADLSEMSSVNAVPIRIIAKKYASSIDIVYGNDKTMTLEIEDMQQTQVPVTIETSGEVMDGYAIGSQTTDPELVSIKGPVSVVKNIKQVKVVVDISDAKSDISKKVTPICCDSDGNEIDSSRVTLDVSKVKVTIEIWKTKKITLSVKTTGSPADGYTLGAIEYDPQYIYITGESEDLKEISELELPSIDVDGKKAAVEKTFYAESLSLPDGVSLVQSDTEITVKVEINQTDEKSMTISSDDISIVNNQEDYDVEFKDKSIKIQLSGLKSTISGIKVSDLDPQIDVSGLEAGEHSVRVTFNDITNVDISGTKKITIELIDSSTTTTEESE